jgi:preprotein translocase subunit Sss1
MRPSPERRAAERKQLELSHWLMIAGAAILLFGVVGFIVCRTGD